MQKVAIISVESGQVVARPVATPGGMVLMQPGATLTGDLIARLMDLGVDHVWLEGVGPDAKPVETLLAELEERFTGHEQDSLMMELQHVVANRIRQAGMDGRDG
jgi:hypothetical protein